jgi:hypothetical protein
MLSGLHANSAAQAFFDIFFALGPSHRLALLPAHFTGLLEKLLIPAFHFFPQP